MVGALLPALLLAAAPSANAAIPTGIGFTQEGCNNPGGLVLPNGSGDFICPDADYTTGNLGKNWGELDLVPFRVTVSASNSAPSTSTFSFAVAVDNTDSGKTGFDVLSAPVLNTDLSDPSCSAATVGAQTTANGQLLRLVTITIEQGTDCVYDYYARLAIGAHLWPGSSLHANLADDLTGSTSGIGTKAVSINPNEIAPQELSKTMTASQDSDHMWNVVKSPSPASLSFTNTCDQTAGALQQNVNITVTWTKLAADPSGVVNVITNVYATNPASRNLTLNVSDQIYSGTTAIGSPATAGPIVITHNTADILVLTHTTTVPAGTTDLNDIATGTYTDTVTGVPIPGTTTATASATVQSSGIEHNTSASITDVESTTGTGLTFSVNSTTGASGTFGGGYTLGTHTVGPVSWTSATQSDSGSVTFHKTVYASAASVVDGSLDDTATLTGSDGFTTSDDASVDISTDASTSLTVTKDQTLSFASAKLFTFHLFDAGTDTATGDTATVTIAAGSLGPVTSDPITGLSPTGSYYVKEDATAPFGPQTSSTVTFSLVAGSFASCSADIQLTNSAEGAHARVQKVTVPDSNGDWTFTLTGPNALSETLSNVTANAGYVSFASSLDVDGGTYTITETQQSGYDLTDVTGDINGNTARVSTSTSSRTCSFVLNLSTDSDQTLSCTFTNTLRGHVQVIKTVSNNPPSGSQSFTFQLRSGASTTQAGTILETLAANAGNGGVLNFTTDLVPGQTYQLCEQLQPGWTTNLGPSAFVVFNSSGDNSVVCIDFTVTPGQLKVISVDNTPPPGGTALTIGYWRNWSSCTAGKQRPVLDQKLLAAANAGTPFTVGLLVLNPHVLGAATACRDAVRILSKSRIDTGVKKARDPLFNLAAQLLAADLNVFSGADTCAAATSAINQAHTLLSANNFDGKTHDSLTNAEVNQAHTLASKLDQYNNNLLC